MKRRGLIMQKRPTTCEFKKEASHASLLMRALLLCSGLTPVAAFAQSADNSPNDQKLQTIVITAQRREQNLQDTPISVSAFNPKTLKESGVTNLPELSQVDPSLEFSGNVGVVYPFL